MVSTKIHLFFKMKKLCFIKINDICYFILTIIFIISLPFSNNLKIHGNSYIKEYATNFQNPKTGIMLAIMELHDYIMLFLILIFIVVASFIYIAVTESYNLIYCHFEKKILHKLVNFFYSRDEYRFKQAHDFEFLWTIIPGAILLLMAYPSLVLLYAIDELIQPVYTISVVGNQWYWTYEYNDFNLHILFEHLIKNSEKSLDLYNKKLEILKYLPRHFAESKNMAQFLSIDSTILPDDDLPIGYPRLLCVDQVLVLPINVPLRVLVTSNDVIHSWAIPSFGVKMDAVPGRINQVSLKLLFSGTSWGQCSELCGVNHGFMPIEIRAMHLSEFLKYIELNAKANISPFLYKFDMIFNHPKLLAIIAKNEK